MRPNILLITTDQQRYDCVGANRNPLIQTPNLDRLAAEGVRFEQCYIQNPVCMPSRASLLTGRYCQNHGVRKNGTPLDPSQPNLAKALLAAGYQTAHVGKIHLLPHFGRDYDAPHPSLEYGFQTMVVSDEPGSYRDEYIRWVEREHPAYLEAVRAPVPMPPGETPPPGALLGPRGLFDGRRQDAPPEVSHSGWVATTAIEFLEAHAARARSDGAPFFLHAGIYAPHPPLFAPPPFDTMYDPADMPLPVRRPHEQDGRPDHFQGAARRNVEVSDDEWRRAKAFYYGMVSLADSQIGRILDALDRLGLAEQTVVVFTSDHGEALGDHYVTGKGPTNYDCIVRVPLIVRWPGAGSGLPAGRAISGLVEHVDVAPTLLEAAGAPSYPGMKGQSLLPLARGERDQGRPNVLIEFRDVKTGFSVKTVRSSEYKYTRSRRNGETDEVLFDLRHDPNEFDDVAHDPAHASALQELRGRLLDRLQDAEDDLPQPTGIW